jgi:hypothetical protein
MAAPATSHHVMRACPVARRRASSSSSSSATTTTARPRRTTTDPSAASLALAIEYPASAPGDGDRGRGLFTTSSDVSAPLVRTPLSVVLCVPEATGPAANAACADAVRAMYAGWTDVLGRSPPPAVVDFVVAAEAPKDLRIAIALMYAKRHVPAWAAYASDVMPRAYESLYLATEDELHELQDDGVARMAAGSKANYAAGWTHVLENHPDVVDALNAEGGGSVGCDATQEEFDWARATAHTRAMGAPVKNQPCAFIGARGAATTIDVPHAKPYPRTPPLARRNPKPSNPNPNPENVLAVPGVDLANHSFWPNTRYGVSQDGTRFELRWDPASPPPEPNSEVLICYGERMPNALLMLHYGFLDPKNPNDALDVQLMIPGARRLRAIVVADAGRALEEARSISHWSPYGRVGVVNADP